MHYADVGNTFQCRPTFDEGTPGQFQTHDTKQRVDATDLSTAGVASGTASGAATKGASDASS